MVRARPVGLAFGLLLFRTVVGPPGAAARPFVVLPCFVSGLVVFVGVLVWVAALVQPTAVMQLHHDCLGKAPCPGVAVRRQARR